MNRETQYVKIVRYLKANEWLSPMGAFPMGITKLATRVSEMIRQGYEFEKEWVGNHEYMKYKLISVPERKEKADA